MLFGLLNAPTSFQRYINKMLADKLDIFDMVYLDDIFIYTKNLGQAHVDLVHWVLEILWKYDLFVNLKKCRLYKNKICFLGYVILVQDI